MASGYLRRNDVGYPQQPNPRGIYAVQYFEDADPEALKDLVNAYLFELPEATGRWVPHLISTEFGYYGTGGTARHTCWLTVFAAGTITSPPT